MKVMELLVKFLIHTSAVLLNTKSNESPLLMSTRLRWYTFFSKDLVILPEIFR